MVETIERDRNDLFAYRWGERFFKNPKTLFVVRSVALGVFVYALAYGFVHPEASENHFTTAIFWSFFWPFFMFLSLPTLGAYFCSVCPLAFVGKKIIKRKGRAFNMPKALKNPYINLFGAFDFIAVGWTLLLLSRRIDLVSENRGYDAKKSAFWCLALLPVGYLVLCLL